MRKKKESNLALQIIHKETGPLTQKETDEFVSKMPWADIELLAIGQPREIRGYCERNKCFVGQGTCIAKKFFNYGKTSYDCCSCFSNEILEQLNYIFQYNYDGLYAAEWRKKQERKKKDDAKPTVRSSARMGNKPNSGDTGTNRPEEPITKRRGRPKKVQQEEPIVKRGRGRPRKNPLPEQPTKKKRGRPKKEK